MLTKELNALFQRDLKRLKKELLAFSEGPSLWQTQGSAQNSPGNLALHLVGNLNHFIGAVLGDSGYVRDRKAEFATRDVPVSSMVEQVEATAAVVGQVLEGMDPADLGDNYPLEVFGEPMTIRFFLVHLEGHLNYHLGQINYQRRLLES